MRGKLISIYHSPCFVGTVVVVVLVVAAATAAAAAAALLLCLFPRISNYTTHWISNILAEYQECISYHQYGIILRLISNV